MRRPFSPLLRIALAWGLSLGAHALALWAVHSTVWPHSDATPQPSGVSLQAHLQTHLQVDLLPQTAQVPSHTAAPRALHTPHTPLRHTPAPTLTPSPPAPQPSAIQPTSPPNTPAPTPPQAANPSSSNTTDTAAAPVPSPAHTTANTTASTTTNTPAPSNIASPAERSEAPLTEAAYVYKPKPEYPRMSWLRGEQGVVVLHVLIGTEGQPLKTVLHRSSGYPLLDQAALNAAQTWRYMPAKRAGQPQAQWFAVPIAFEQLSR